ncbi:MAG TPA: diacylglycerol kinase family protein [Allosphingosinicella sp.]|nr:diacylglycerol kinase family protein [Allosphingosinicella sp.]
MTSVALLSNPKSTGNRSLLPEVRAFCARHRDIFHYEVEDVGQIAEALRTIARVRPQVLVINGGDGTVQAALTEIYHGGHFGVTPPPVAVLPNGKTNLIARDLGAAGDPIEALERVLDLVRTDLVPHIVSRELIELTRGGGGAGEQRPVLGMFLGGAGLADTILYCRHKIYPLGLPNWAAHGLTFLMGLVSVIVGRRSRLLPAKWAPIKVSVTRSGAMQGKLAFVMVTTLERLLLNSSMTGGGPRAGAMQVLVIERNLFSILVALLAAVRGRLGLHRIRGVHFSRGDEIRIEGSSSSVILDGEMFEANDERPIVLRPTAPVPFLRLAA